MRFVIHEHAGCYEWWLLNDRVEPLARGVPLHASFDQCVESLNTIRQFAPSIPVYRENSKAPLDDNQALIAGKEG